MSAPFDYDQAFSRNIGWVTETEQQFLRTRCVAIAGLGGVGGSHLLTLTRLGMGRPKVEVLEELARDINPELQIETFPRGISEDNMDEFLKDVDLYLDGLLPGKMTFEEYFRLEGQPEQEQLLRFLLGLSPAMLQASYLVDDSRVDLSAHKGPSTAMACELCAGVAATQVLKILTKRGKVVAAPQGIHLDAYRNRLKTTWRPGGNRNPLQKIGLAIAKKRLSRE